MKLLRTFEKIYVVVSMLFLTNGIFQRAIAQSDVAGQTSPVPEDRIGELLVCLILVPLLIVHSRKILAGLRQSGWIVALCSLAIASAAWSSDWRFTLRRGVLLTAITLFAVYVASCFDWDEQLDLFGWLSVIAVVGSAFMAIFVPYYGISHDIHAGAVKGIFPHKNILGRQMVFAILTLWLAKPKGIPVWLRNCTLAVACVLVVLSSAATSMIALAVCVVMYPVLELLRIGKRRTVPLWVPLAPLLAAGTYLVLSNFGLILQAAGRTNTLSGRTVIWASVFRAVSDRKWLGYGLDVFWSHVVWPGGDLPTAHNGYLDIVLALGIVGLLVYIGGFLTNLWRASRLFWANEIRGAKWPLFILLFFGVFNFTESNILRLLTYLWIPYVTIYVSLGLMRVEERYALLSRSAIQDVDDGRPEPEPSPVNGGLPGYGV